MMRCLNLCITATIFLAVLEVPVAKAAHDPSCLHKTNKWYEAAQRTCNDLRSEENRIICNWNWVNKRSSYRKECEGSYHFEGMGGPWSDKVCSSVIVGPRFPFPVKCT